MLQRAGRAAERTARHGTMIYDSAQCRLKWIDRRSSRRLITFNNEAVPLNTTDTPARPMSNAAIIDCQ